MTTTADIFLPIQSDLAAVEAKLRAAALENQHPALTSALDHLLASGGKRVRPATALLAARLFAADPAHAVALAAAIEMLHTATLVHDDLIDGSLLRRGLPTLNAQWTPGATVLTGDFLFARAAELAAETESVRVMGVFSRTLMIIVNGEINQMFIGRGQASRAGYLDRIYAKTASLFAVAAEAGAILGGAGEPTVAALRHFGREIGMAFQIVDDILDFTGDQARLGKPVGSDLRQGLFTLPVLCYLDHYPDDPHVAALLDGHAGESDRVAHVVAAVRASPAIDEALAEAAAYVARARVALAAAPANRYRRSLADLAEYFVSRSL
ncbi:MAG: polyprenyl synthetase family protein [Anaerolineales bacterium]|nr:polyprenyl synthetase family protein [Anaerolineales bacterium]